MNNLRTLALTKCFNLPFILVLKPGKIPSSFIMCPESKDLVIYIEEHVLFYIVEMLNMAEGRSGSFLAVHKRDMTELPLGRGPSMTGVDMVRSTENRER